MTALQTATDLYRAGKLREAVPYLQRACDEEPYNPETWYRCGVALMGMRDYRGAAMMLAEAISYDPTSASAHYNLGVAYEASGQDTRAERHYHKALEYAPGNLLPYVNLGGIAYRAGRDDVAVNYHDLALSAETDDPDQLGQRSFVRLLRGDYTTGWQEYECRWESPQVQSTNWRPRQIPRWDGQPFETPTEVLIYAEQGLGDTIQMLRYHDLLLSRNVVPVYAISPACVPLLSPEVAIVPPQTEPPDVHWSLSMMSLPFVFQTTRDTIPRTDWYLAHVPYRTEIQIERSNRPLVGVCTHGNKDHMNDHDRSIPRHLRTFYETELGHGIDWVVLDREDCYLDLRDLGDTRDLIIHLDAVVTVDTAIAHLAGALGVQTYLLPPSSPEWRWGMPSPGHATRVPWYDSITAYWRHNTREWPGVLQRVCDAVRGDLA